MLFLLQIQQIIVIQKRKSVKKIYAKGKFQECENDYKKKQINISIDQFWFIINKNIKFNISKSLKVFFFLELN